MVPAVCFIFHISVWAHTSTPSALLCSSVLVFTFESFMSKCSEAPPCCIQSECSMAESDALPCGSVSCPPLLHTQSTVCFSAVHCDSEQEQFSTKGSKGLREIRFQTKVKVSRSHKSWSSSEQQIFSVWTHAADENQALQGVLLHSRT